MNVEMLRASSIQTYKFCPFQYYLINYCGIESKTGQKASIGNAVHGVLESMARAKKIGRHTQSRKYNDPDYLIKIWSEKEIKKYPYLEWSRADRKAVEKHVAHVLASDYHPHKLNVIATEKQFRLEVARSPFKDFYLGGTIDLITELDKDTLEIVDWKTGRRTNWITDAVKELEDFNDDTQFGLYNLVLKTMFPQYKNRIFTVYYTQDGGPFTFAFSPEDEAKTWEKIRRAYHEIKADENPQRLKDDIARSDQHWKCKNVCQFGRQHMVRYRNEKTQKIEQHIMWQKEIEPCIEDEENLWVFDGSEPLCDHYNKIRQGRSLDDAKGFIQLTVERGPVMSKRNDYSNPKIYKGSIS